MKLTKHGFTLTELMAVVIIIGILAGIGFGSYQKAIERSRFSEGLAAGAAVQEAVNRYYYENTDLASSARKYPKIAYLDISLANAKECATKSDYCVRTKYFEVIVSNSGSVYAYHMKGLRANCIICFGFPVLVPTGKAKPVPLLAVTLPRVQIFVRVWVILLRSVHYITSRKIIYLIKNPAKCGVF